MAIHDAVSATTNKLTGGLPVWPWWSSKEAAAVIEMRNKKGQVSVLSQQELKAARKFFLPTLSFSVPSRVQKGELQKRFMPCFGVR